MIPNEIFTYPLSNKDTEAKKAFNTHFCRFTEKKCDKQSRLLNYPLGICSVKYASSFPIICPHRFLENKLVFKNVCEQLWGDTNNILIFSEVKLENIGSFDFVLVKHKTLSSQIEDFCIVEIQSDSTTGTGQLVKAMQDFMNNEKLQAKYKFGMNTYNTIKLSYIQMLIKGQLLEKWNKKIFWIMQDFVFENMVNRFKLTNLTYNKELTTQFQIYNLTFSENIYKLQLFERKSSTISNLLKAFTHQPVLPIEYFIKVLEDKIKLKVGISFDI